MKNTAKKGLDDVVVPDRFAMAEKALDNAPKKLPTISPLPEPKSPEKERRNSSISLPKYVWKLLRQRSATDDEPQNVIILRALKAYGFQIDEEDLTDPRKLRYQS